MFIPQPQTRKDKGVAVIFALFLGGLGIHNFYLEEYALGILHLVFCWTMIPSIVALVEAIVIASSSNWEQRWAILK
jgi:TM2 domain-containing membrane protein YozV